MAGAAPNNPAPNNAVSGGANRPPTGCFWSRAGRFGSIMRFFLVVAVRILAMRHSANRPSADRD
jgi:hypothetical protein